MISTVPPDSVFTTQQPSSGPLIFEKTYIRVNNGKCGWAAWGNDPIKTLHISSTGILDVQIAKARKWKLLIKGNHSNILTRLIKLSYLIYNETMFLILYNISKYISKVTREHRDFVKNGSVFCHSHFYACKSKVVFKCPGCSVYIL